MKFSASIETFAADRRRALETGFDTLAPAVEDALRAFGSEDWFIPILDAAIEVWNETQNAEGSNVRPTSEFMSALSASLERTSTPSVPPDEVQVRRIANWVAVYAINASTMAAAQAVEGEFVLLEWVTMEDEDVRDLHRPLNGVQVPVGERFQVGESELRYPGEPIGSPEVWINCRCVCRPVLGDASTVEFSAWTAESDSGARSSKTTKDASSGQQQSTTAATASGRSRGSVPSRPTGGPGSTGMVNSLMEGLITSAIQSLSQKGDVPEAGASTASASTLITSNRQRPSSRQSVGSNPQSEDSTALASGPNARRGIPTPKRTPGGAPGGTGTSSASAEPANGTTHTGSVAPKRTSTEAPVGQPEPVVGEEMTAQTFAMDPEEDLEDPPMLESTEEFEFDMVPVYGVLAPVNVLSGDGRTLTEVTWAEVPQALRWVKQDVGYHDGAVRVGTITDIFQDGELIRWSGNMLNTPEADEVINLLAEGKMGISVDLDSTAMEIDEELMDPGEMPQMRVSGRIRAATLVDIPAFVEAYAMLGFPEEEMPEGEVLLACAPCMAKELDEHYATLVEFAISEASWDGSASRFSDEEWIRSTVVDRGEEFETPKERYAVPILEPNGDLNRAAVHNAAARINQVDAPPAAIAAGKRKLVAAYRRLDEEPPESLTASAFQVDTHDAPGWITHPVPTQRIRNYWTRGEGAAKIKWGVPGDFNRCRSQLRKYIANPQWLAGTCANLHYVALGVWPGRESTRVVEGALMASAFTIYEETNVLPAEWFVDPELKMPTPVTVTREGRVFGHIAQWGVCHVGLGLSIGMDDTCTEAPHSPTNYAYYRTGVVDTDQGEIPVGNLTMGIGHAPDKASARATIAHYDNVNAVVADVVTGEDEFGIWFSGAMRPNLTDDQVRAFKGATLSGDWRTIGGELELVAALAVNVPGFGIPRLSLAASGGRQTALIAAGMVKREETVDLTVNPATVRAFADAVIANMALREETKKVKAKYRAAERKRLAARL